MSEALGPVRIETYRHLLTALTEEMGAALRRSAYSPNIKERRDYSCALFDGRGRVVAMGDHMPVHLGAMPASVKAALDDLGPLHDGDVVALNDPFRGGTHLPDITLVAPVFGPTDPERALAYVAARAHHADVGGMSAGSMPLAREIYQEGLRLPPILLMRGGRAVEDVWRIILANVRTPRERQGDLSAQIAALNTGRTRLLELAARNGEHEIRSAMDGLLDYADRLVRAGIRAIPDGDYSGEDFIEDDGFDSGPLAIRVTLRVRGDEVEADFAGTAAQAKGGVNAVEAITASGVRYVLRCVIEALLEQPLPAGGGEMSCLRLALPPRSLVAAEPPASVAAGNVETSQRITDVVMLALSLALPRLMPAQSQGTMNNLTVGGIDPRNGEPFAYYETLAGGQGAGPTADGLSAVHVHMSNSRNTPVEALEHAYPVRVERYAIRRGSGGSGLHHGGDGVRRDVRLLTECSISLLTERRTLVPKGAAGGGPGEVGGNVAIGADGAERPLPGKGTLWLPAGTVLSLRSPGGGGWGVSGSDAGSRAPDRGGTGSRRS